MKKFSIALLAFVALLAQGSLGVQTASAQFSQAVVVMKGTVVIEDNNAPIAVKVSVRAVNDTAMEVTSSRSNSETGSYLVVLKPGKKYWVHLESDQIHAKDTLVETPMTDKYAQIVHNFTVTPLSTALVATPKGEIDFSAKKLDE